MSSCSIWMVRSGRNAVFAAGFLEGNFVGIGFPEAGIVSRPVDKAALRKQIKDANPNLSSGKVENVASQIKRFFDEVAVGDNVITYDASQRLYYFGTIESDVKERQHYLSRTRDVSWTGQVSRDSLSQGTRNVLGSVLSLFLVPDDAATELRTKLASVGSEEIAIAADSTVEISEELHETIEGREEQADQLLDDKLASLSWDDMQELVAELLRSMGFRAEVSAKGGDQGVDIFASPDGLGLHEPRIFVEVKHRTGSKISAEQIRSFLGGRHAGDRCLYVSTGGFSKEAVYEAARSSRPCTLIDLPKLRNLIKENYTRFTPEGLALLPLRRIYLPAN